jgi:hypothetical protein
MSIDFYDTFKDTQNQAKYPFNGKCVKLCVFADAMVYSSVLSFSGHT